MKIIIEQQGIKRELDGPFALCAGREDLERLHDLIGGKLEAGFSYGWITIYGWPDVQRTANTKPKPWAEV